ncbi:glycoside hydrolase superfamily [Cladochytrium replicatum]|nr:glycoside hydrolase superfamily [Cladochytrium replicatum]
MLTVLRSLSVLLVILPLIRALATKVTAVEPSQLPLRTAGRFFVDAQNNRVKLGCVNWHGFHMSSFAANGLYQNSSRQIAATIRRLGFNCVRLNWSVAMVIRNPTVLPEVIAGMSGSTLVVGPGSSGVNALTLFDAVVADLASEKIMIIIDQHTSEPIWCCDPSDGNGLWFTGNYTYAQTKQAWQMMASRYANQPYVIGADLRNEVRAVISTGKPPVFMMPSWGTGDRNLTKNEYLDSLHLDADTRAFLDFIGGILKLESVTLWDWKKASEELGALVMAANPNLVVIVGGVFDSFSFEPSIVPALLSKADLGTIKVPPALTRWEQFQNLTGIATNPITSLDRTRLAYSAHVYPFNYEFSKDKYDGKSPTYAYFAGKLDDYWGFLASKNSSPIWVGELGVAHTDSSLKGIWNDYIIRYMVDMLFRDFDFAYWPLIDGRAEVINNVFVPGEDSYSLLDKLNGK